LFCEGDPVIRTISLIKADVGSIGGHTAPSPAMMEVAYEELCKAISNGLINDGFTSHTGDDIALLMSHERGENSPDIHNFAWQLFLKVADKAREKGLYAAGQDLLAHAPSGNIRGAGPAVAEIQLEYDTPTRPAEAFLMFAADKCGSGAYNLPLFLACADPMYCSGLMLPAMIKGFTFEIIDMNATDGDSVIELHAPEDYYKITMLLRDNGRFGVQAIYSRTHDYKMAAASAHRLHTIAGKYVGKDDPVALVRVQGVFPAPEEVVSPYMLAPYVGGGARGSHVMPLMPVPLNTPVTGPYCLPIVACAGFSLSPEGKFSHYYVDFFDNPAWDYVRLKAQEKGIEMRKQGWSGPAMLPYTELEYGGFKTTLEDLLKQFVLKPAGKS
jgi:fructose 1,6-bisphosphate aldolase/phosphatase